MTYQEAYIAACREACPEGCGKGRPLVPGRERVHPSGGFDLAIRCTAPTFEKWAEQQYDARIAAEAAWRCYHCGYETSDPVEAEAHFGERDDASEFTPTCTWWNKLSAEDRAQEFQDLQQSLNEERLDNGNLLQKIEGLEYRLLEFEDLTGSRFKGCKSIDDAFNLYDSMEGRALVAEERADRLQAAPDEATFDISATGDEGQMTDKIIHLASLVSPHGDVSALCYSKPRAIDLSKQSWSNRPEAVTCQRCITKLRENNDFMLKTFDNPVCGECGGTAIYSLTTDEWRHFGGFGDHPEQQLCSQYGYPLKSVVERLAK